MKEFRALLLGVERENKVFINSLSQSMFALYIQGAASSSMGSQNQNGVSSQNTDFSQSRSSSHDCYPMAPANNFGSGLVRNNPYSDNFYKL